MVLVTLHCLRHGQAEHNLAEIKVVEKYGKLPGIHRVPDYDGEELLDPKLTDYGLKQAKEGANHQPEALKSNKPIEFWVSPCRRAIETAMYSVPSATKWRIAESLRERSGARFCDSRRDRSEILAWCHKEFPHVCEWEDGFYDEKDPLQPKPREDALRMLRRVMEALNLVWSRVQATNCTDYVWVSHSAFLSMLFCLLDVFELPKRWLDNNEWRSVTLPFPDTLQLGELRLKPAQPAVSLAVYPEVLPNERSLSSSLSSLDWVDRNRSSSRNSTLTSINWIQDFREFFPVDLVTCSFRNHISMLVAPGFSKLGMVTRPVYRATSVLRSPLRSIGTPPAPDPRLDALVAAWQAAVDAEPALEPTPSFLICNEWENAAVTQRSPASVVNGCRVLSSRLKDDTPERKTPVLVGGWRELAGVVVDKMGLVTRTDAIIICEGAITAEELENPSSINWENRMDQLATAVKIAAVLLESVACHNASVILCPLDSE